MISATVLPSTPALPVGFRRPTRDDMPFVLLAWARGARDLPEFAAVEGSPAPIEHFGAWFNRRMARVLRAESTSVLLACDLEDAKTLHGFIAVNRARRGLLWLYVKQAFRRMGLGRRLLDEALPGWSPPLRVAYCDCAARLPGYVRERRPVYDPSLWG